MRTTVGALRRRAWFSHSCRAQQQRREFSLGNRGSETPVCVEHADSLGEPYREFLPITSDLDSTGCVAQFASELVWNEGAGCLHLTPTFSPFGEGRSLGWMKLCRHGNSPTTLRWAGTSGFLHRPEIVLSHLLVRQITREECTVRATSDLGQGIRETNQASRAASQKRSTGQTSIHDQGGHASLPNPAGSMWVPARIDLDTAVSKLDPRIMQPTTIITGALRSTLRPWFPHLVTQLLDARYEANAVSSRERRRCSNTRQTASRGTAVKR